MEEKDLQVSKFMKSMMNSNEIGFKKDGDKQINSDDEDSVWDCISYMFKVKNLWIYAIFTFLALFTRAILAQNDIIENATTYNLAAIGIFAIFGYCLSYGYLFPFIKTLSEQQKTYSMPKFNFWQCLGLFFKFNIALALFLAIIALAFLVITLAIFPITKAIIFTVSNPAPQSISIIYSIIMLIVLCFFCFYSPAMFWLFSNKGYWTSFVRFKEIFNLVKRNKSRYLDAIGISLIVFIVTLIFICIVSNPYLIHINGPFNKTVLAINKLLPIFLNTIIGTYSMFVFAYICAKCISAKELES